jgi:hypothetical protein
MTRWTRCSLVFSTVRNVENGCGTHTARDKAAVTCSMCAEVRNVYGLKTKSRFRNSLSSCRSGRLAILRIVFRPLRIFVL